MSRKVKIYILTYNSERHLNEGLASLFQSDLSAFDVEVFVINNHTHFCLYEEFCDKVTVLHNPLQPDFGTGHSSRNWNQALMLGFKDLNQPDADLVVCAQDDSTYHSGWLNLLGQAHFEMGYDFVACGVGDNLCSYTANAIKKTGLWDERFCALHYAEHDYFLRAAMWLGEKASINDNSHGDVYTLHVLPFGFEIIHRPEQEESKLQLREERKGYGYICRDLFKAKWGGDHPEMQVSKYVNRPIKPLHTVYLFYPYFERNVEQLNEKGYNWGTPYTY